MKTLKVILWGKEIGVLSENPDNPNYFLFKYNEDFVKQGIEICPIAMPLSNEVYVFDGLSLDSFKGLPPLLSDSLPDRYGNKLLSVWSKKYNKASLNPIEVLSYIGKRAMGALEYIPSTDDTNGLENIEIDELVEVANDVLNNRMNIQIDLKKESNLKKLIDVGSSIGGARAKAIIAITKDNIIKSGQIAGIKDAKYCILKFDGLNSDLSEDKEITYYTRIEYSYYLMCTDCGIEMEESFLYEKNSKYHFVTKRFDRNENGEKIHSLTLGGMAGFDYEKKAEHSYEEIARILDRIGCSYNDKCQLFSRMVFNVLARNQDDHVKNITFLMDKNGNWRLSPAYDMTYSYNENGEYTRFHQMRINNKITDIKRVDLVDSGINMGIKKSKINEIIDKIQSVVDNYQMYGEKANLPDKVIDEIKNNFPTI